MEDSSDVIAVDRPADGAVVNAESELTVELLATTLAWDDVVE